VASSSNESDEHYCVWIACEGFFIYTLAVFLAADVEKVRYNDLFMEEEDAIIVSKIDVTNRILLLWDINMPKLRLMVQDEKVEPHCSL
jgi:hypothetical protein